MIQPFGKNILIKPIVKKQVLVSQEELLTDTGEVIAVGDKVKDIKVGDTIAYLFWGTNSVDIGNEKFWLIPEDDNFILGKIK